MGENESPLPYLADPNTQQFHRTVQGVARSHLLLVV